jgi:hypothetical protein
MHASSSHASVAQGVAMLGNHKVVASHRSLSLKDLAPDDDALRSSLNVVKVNGGLQRLSD